MAYKHRNSQGVEYHLHSTTSPRSGKKLYHFAKVAKEEGQEHQLPAGYTVSENPQTKLPILKKVK